LKKLKYFCSAILALSLLAIPAAAQKSERSNKGGATTGKARADQVQDDNKDGKKKRKRKDHDSNPDKWEKGQHKGKTQGEHNAKGHR
jgi:Ni/Co efflux regulator RcnB